MRAYTKLIAEELDLSAAEIDRLQWAGLAHDVGKLFVPTEILTKPGRLTDDEYELVKTHTVEGARLVEPLRGWLGDALDGVREHHERWDGRGYPDGLEGTEISLAGRIVAVADVFDVITSVRSYKKASAVATAREELVRCSGTQFDPKAVRAFLNIGLGRLRLLVGPLSWLAQLPVVGRVPLGAAASAAAGPAVATFATAAALVAGGFFSSTTEPALAAEAASATVDAAVPVASPAVTNPVLVTTTILPVTGTTVPVRQPPPETIPQAVVTVVPSTVPVTTRPAAPPTRPPTSVLPMPTIPAASPPAVTTTTAPPAVTTTTAPPPVAPTTTAPPPVTPTTTAPPPVTTTTTTTPPPGTTTTTTTTTPPPAPAPTAVNDAASTDEDAAIVVDTLGNDLDPAGGGLTIISVGSHLLGSGSTDGSTITFTPTADRFGAAAISYSIRDSAGNTDSGSIAITITAVDDPPTLALLGDVTVDEDSGPASIPGWATAGPGGGPDESGQSLTVTVVPDDPALFLDPPTVDVATGTLTFNPEHDANGSTRLTVTVDDGTSTTSSTANLTINPIDDIPVTAPDSYLTPVNAPLTVAAPGLLGNDYDPEGLTLGTVASVQVGAKGTLTILTDGSFAYIPLPLATGLDQFTYTVIDAGGNTATGTVEILISNLTMPTGLFFGTSGVDPLPLDGSPPTTTGPEADHDADGNPGLTVEHSGGKYDDDDPSKYQTWAIATTQPLVLNGPVAVDFWSTAENFDPKDDVDYSFWLHDCDTAGTNCTQLAWVDDIHVSEWNGGSTTWVRRTITIGSVDTTVAANRRLVLRAMFGHHDVWIAASGDRPSQLVLPIVP